MNGRWGACWAAAIVVALAGAARADSQLLDDRTVAFYDFRTGDDQAMVDRCGGGSLEVEGDSLASLRPGTGILLDGRTRLTGPLAALTAPLTVEALIRLDGESPGKVHGLFEQFRYLMDGCRMGISGSGNRVEFQVSDPKAGAMVSVFGKTALELGRWYHIAATYDGRALRVFVNGREDGAQAWEGGLVPSRSGMTVGYESGPNYYFVGAIGYLRISKAARTAFPGAESPTGPPAGPLSSVSARYPEVSAYLFPAGEAFPVACTVRNEGDVERSFTLQLEATPLGGEAIRVPPVTVVVPARGQRAATIPVKLTRRAMYQVALVARSGGEEVQRQALPPFAIVEPLPPLPKTPAASRFGGQPTYAMPGSDRVGMKWDRFWDYATSWHEMEPERGRFVWDKTDQLVSQAKARGEEILWCLCYTPKWASAIPDRATALADPMLTATYGSALPGLYDSGTLSRQYPAKDLADWSRYVAAMVRRYGDRVRYWEIWNEANCANFIGTPRRYFEVLQAAYEAIKGVDPKAVVVGIAGCPGWQGFTEEVLKLGGLRYMDVLAFHDYAYEVPEVFGCDRKVAETRELMRRYGRVLPMWDTEVGHPIPPKVRGRPMTWDEFHRNLERAAAHEPVPPFFAQCDVTRRGNDVYATYAAIWPTTEDRAAKYLVRQYVLEMSEGLERFFLHAGASIAQGKLPRLNGIAHAMMARVLATATFVRRLPTPGDTARVYLFRGEGRNVAVAWSTQESEKLVMLTSVRRLPTADLYGNPGEAAGDGRRIVLSLTDSPRYLFDVPEKVAFQQPLGARAPATAIAGESFPVAVTVDNAQPEVLSGAVTLTGLPERWRVEPDRRAVEVRPGGRAAVEFRVSPPAEAPRGKVGLQAVLDAAGTRWTAPAPVMVLQVVPCPPAPASARLDGDLAEWAEPPARIDAASQVVLGKPSPMFEKVAGTWWGLDDLSAKLWYGRTADALLVALEVRDDSLVPPTDMRQAYQRDCVELFLDGRRREEFANPGYGPGVAQALISPPEAAGRCEVHVVRGVLQGVEAVGKRTPYGYTVEARVPLTRGAFPELRLQPGSLLGFDVALDDADDGGERKAQLVWQGSATNCSDTSLFGRLRL